MNEDDYERLKRLIKESDNTGDYPKEEEMGTKLEFEFRIRERNRKAAAIRRVILFIILAVIILAVFSFFFFFPWE